MIRAAPQLVTLQSYRSVYSMVSKYVQDPNLRQAFSYHTLLVGGNPFNTSAIYALIHALEKRWGEPEDVGKAVAALVRGDLPYATGQVLNIDGGMTIHHM